MIMERRCKSFVLCFFSLLSYLLFSCGIEPDSHNYDPQNNSNTGQYQCKLILSSDQHPTNVDRRISAGAEGERIDCDGISFVKLFFFNERDEPIASDQWPCSARTGILNGIPAGTGRWAMITVHDENGVVVLRGEQRNITIIAGQTIQGESIELKYVTSNDDSDGDGFSFDNDCDDTNDTIHPDAIEIPDNDIDENCDGLKDQTWYQDSDFDNFGNPFESIISANEPEGYVSNNMDCNDNDANINPDATEIEDNDIDEDCTPESFENSRGMIFNRIPSGRFVMGSPTTELGREEEEVQHDVILTQDFYMQTTEVTQAQWLDVMGNNPSENINCGMNCPVENVSWLEIQTFIARLDNLREGTYRLPTEAEWEYAARANTATALASGDLTAEGCDYDENLDIIGWYCYNSPDGPQPVAQKLPNNWGLYDMHGNVWEWCHDTLGPYPMGPVTDPKGAVDDNTKVMRGGGYTSFLDVGAEYCRSAYREGHRQSTRYKDLGFRLVYQPDMISTQ